MRYFCLALIALALSASQSSGLYAQNNKDEIVISLSFKDKSLASVLDMIAKQGKFLVTYTDEVKRYETTLTASLDRVSAVEAVQQLLKNTPFTYTVEGRSIKVFKVSTSAASATQGQETIEGVVVDSKGEAIPFATIAIKGTTSGAIAKDDGTFSFVTNATGGDIQVSCIGYTTRVIPYKVGEPLKIVLESTAQNLGEVVVVAYGKRNVRELVGSISSVKADKLQHTPSASIENLLQGHMAGVEVTNVSGTPGGGGSQITIRGLSSIGGANAKIDGSPLFVIDGVPVVSTTSEQTGGINTLAGLDPSSIESVEVLKDAASASLYGSRAGNGVILITTKKGKTGKSEFSVNVSQSYSWLPETPMQVMGKGERDFALLLAKMQRLGHYDAMTNRVVIPKSHRDSWGWGNYEGAYDYLWRNGLRLSEEERIPGMVQDSLNTFYNNRTNWWKYAFRVGRVTKADAMVSGGKENIKYMINAGFYDETGIMLSSSFKRFSLLSNLDLNLTPRLTAFLRTNLSYTDKNAGEDMGKIQGLTLDPTSSSTLLPGKGSIAEREASKKLLDIKRENSNYNIRLNAGFNYEILKGLRFSSTAALDHYSTRSYRFTPSYLAYDKRSLVDESHIGMTMLQFENLLNYELRIKDSHVLDFMTGITYNRDLLRTLGGEARNGPTDYITYAKDWGDPLLLDEANNNYIALQKFSNNKEEQAMQSYLGRVAYNYKQRYLAEFSIRADGSSVFGSAVRWGLFPSMGLGWAFSQEKFMKNLWWLNFGKLRASWGRSGQKFPDAYLALGVMSAANTFMGTLALMPEFMANNKLTWEKSDQYDLGLDLHLLDSRLRFKLDYYYKYSHALLMEIPLPGNFFIADKAWSNSSAISNEGIELEVMADILNRGDWKWSLGFNASHNRNLFRKSYAGEDVKHLVLGRPIYGIYTYQDEGIVQREEDIPYYYNQSGIRRPLAFGTETAQLGVGGRKIKDQNSDGVIDDKDRYYAGTTLPLAYGGISTYLDWKNFSLSLHFSYTLGRKMMNMVKNSAFNFDKGFGTIKNDYRGYSFWEKPGDNADYPSLAYADSDYIGQFDGNIDSNIENVNFLRLKMLTLSYKVPENFLNRFKLKGVNIYLSAENLFLLSNYSGLDPEIVSLESGVDDGKQYPLNRKVTVGLNFKF